MNAITTVGQRTGPTLTLARRRCGLPGRTRRWECRRRRRSRPFSMCWNWWEIAARSAPDGTAGRLGVNEGEVLALLFGEDLRAGSASGA